MKSHDRDILGKFLSEVDDISVLSREAEHELAVRAKTDPMAAQQLVAANLRYVIAIAMSYRRYKVPLGDLVSEGNVGLMIALSKFDPSRGTRFVTYAAHWIRAMILDHVIKSHSMVGLGSGPMRSKVFFRLRRERAKIAAATSDRVEATQILAERFGTTPEKIELMAARLEAHDVSVDVRPQGDGTATILDGMISPLPSQEDALADREEAEQARQRVQAAIAELDARERLIIELRMMADGPDELSLAELGRKLGVSRERARQLEVRAKAKLTKLLRGGQDAVAVAPPLLAVHEGEASTPEPALAARLPQKAA
jgi:RNA polymerase sigma-32 factor